MRASLSRRRFLSITAATMAISPVAAQATTRARWQGRAMGAAAQMTIDGLPQERGTAIFAAVEAELDRLEAIFSLYRGDSQLVQLNAVGEVFAPAPELLDVLSLSASLNNATGGAFDPTVQASWQALALGEQTTASTETGDWKSVYFDSSSVRFTKPGMALTLNGIAQGYITDKIASLLRQQGLTNVLLDMGEIAAIGPRADGQMWQAGIAATTGQLKARVALADRALATSATMGTILSNGESHILDPNTGRGATKERLVSVSAPNAALADGLSTALCLVSRDTAEQVVSQFRGTNLEHFS